MSFGGFSGLEAVSLEGKQGSLSDFSSPNPVRFGGWAQSSDGSEQQQWSWPMATKDGQQ